MTRRLVLAQATAFGSLTAAGVLALCASPQVSGEAAVNDPPEVVYLTGIVRDFRERTKPHGHPDFEYKPTAGFGIYNGNVAPTLGGDNKPVWSGGGWLTKTQWTDSQNRPICYTLYDPARGDKKGVKGSGNSGGVTSAATFNQWFRDVPGVNVSQPLTLVLHRQENGEYVFDDKLDPLYQQRGGFFPVDSQLFGNSGGSPNHNFHFTYELHTEFTYDADTGQVFKFIGDDDVWVFIDGRMVIDLGGVHAARDQVIEVDRLNLEDGETYRLSFFFAERHRTQSNFRIETTLSLSSLEVPSITAAFD